MNFKSLIIMLLSAAITTGFCIPLDTAVGRVRYLDGKAATFTFEEKNYDMALDLLIFPDVPLQTNQSRFEMVDRVENTLWVDQNTSLGYARLDDQQKSNALLLQSGSVIYKTTIDCEVQTPMGSLFLPAEGLYLINVRLDKRAAYVSSLSGPDARIAKAIPQSGNVYLVSKKIENEFTAWQKYRVRDWDITIQRSLTAQENCNIHPYIAYTEAQGSIQWLQVEGAVTNYLAADAVKGFEFKYDTMYAYLANLNTIRMLNLKLDIDKSWFLKNNINGVFWNWSVDKGWFPVFTYKLAPRKMHLAKSTRPKTEPTLQPPPPEKPNRISTSLGGSRTPVKPRVTPPRPMKPPVTSAKNELQDRK